ncbi:MAG: hypothetical protein MZV49_04850, partial [Rhodopseudomonas palustris]|nr:hypothetical protein [Rhodopseudomonas palustris]
LRIAKVNTKTPTTFFSTVTGMLIIMLIVTLPVMTHAVKLDMPQTGNPPPLVPPVVINILVDFHDDSISWNGTPVANLATLERYFKVGVPEGSAAPEVATAPPPAGPATTRWPRCWPVRSATAW